MPTDPNIILQAGNINDPARQEQGMISMFSLAQAVRQNQRETQRVNALRDAFTDPNGVDPTTGLPTPGAIRKVMQADPELGVKLQGNVLEDQVRRAQIHHSQTEAGKAGFDFMSQAAGIGYDAYDDAKKAGKSEDDAKSAGQAARNAAVKNNGGVIGDDVADGILGKPFEPVGAKALAGANKEWSTAYHQREQEDHAAKTEAETGRRLDQGDRRLELLANRPPPSATKWEVLTDPKSNTQYRYNPDTAQSTTLDGKPYAPGGAQRMGSGKAGGEFTPEIGELQAALAEKGVSLPAGMRSREQQLSLYSGILKRHPDKSPDEIANLVKTGQIEFGAQKKETQTAAGVAGRVEVAQNEIQEFTPLVKEAAAKVPRGSFLPLTKLLQSADTQLSDPNLKALKIRINSLLNAYDMLAARGGTDVDKRKEVRTLLTSADSPETLNAALDSFGKEADAAHRAAVKATRVPELDAPGQGGATKIKDAAGYAALSPGEHYIDPSGVARVKK